MSKMLLKSAGLVSSMTFISRIMGFARDLIAAQFFGVNAGVDAFYVAFKIPNFMRNLFAEGAFSQAFVPVLSDYRQKQDITEVRRFISYIAGALALVLAIITVIGMFGSTYLVSFFAPGLDPYRYQLASTMLRITFPYLMFISLTAFVGSVLNSYGRFGLPAFTPVLLNISLIITAYTLSGYFSVPVESQAFGVLIAGFVQLFFLIPALYRIGFLVRPRLSWKDEGVRRVLKLLVPALFGSSVSQISIFISTVLASFLITGSVTWLYYSERLAYFPLGVFGVALATVALPHLSREHASESTDGFSKALDWGVRCNLIIGIPATLAMILLSGPLIISLFQYGKFSTYDVIMTQRSVIGYAIGLQAFMLVKILSSAFYARQNIQTPVKVAASVLITNVLLSILLIKPLAHAGLALATSLSSWINTAILFLILYKKKLYIPQAGWGKFTLKLLISNGLVVLFLYAFAPQDLPLWIHWNWVQRFEHLALLGIGCIVLYALCFWLSSPTFYLRAKLKGI